jgi:pimeloyl-ACP methyl ester carboxylesterase
MIKKIFKWLIFLLVALCLAVLAAGLTYRPETLIPPGWAGHLVDVGGLRLRVLQKGSGPDILLIHGSPGSIEDWTRVFDILAKDHRVTVYDRPGYGFSTGEDLPYTISANAQVALQLIRTLGLHDVTIIGHSYGSVIVLALAEQHPPEARRYILLGPAPYGISGSDPLYHLLALPYFGTGIARILVPLVAEKKIREGIVQSFGPNAGEIPAGFIELRERLWSRPSVGVARAKEVLNFNNNVAVLKQHYREIAVPVIIVDGAQEKYVADARRLQSEIPGATLVEFPQTGHYVPVVRAAELAELVRTAEQK